jgi:hypothetical protein
MNFHVQGLTPTQLAIKERRANFRKSIAEKAEALARSNEEKERSRQSEAVFRNLVVAIAAQTEAVQEPAPRVEEERYGPWLPSSPWFSIVNPMRDYPSIDTIQSVVAKYYGIKRMDILSHRRLFKVTRPRQVAICIAKKMTPLSLTHIGHRFDRDHSTVIHSVEKIEQLMERDQQLASDVESLIEQLTGAQP